MRMLRVLRRHPLTILGACALGFIAWLWRDAVVSRIDSPEADPNVVIADVPPVIRPLPRPPGLEKASDKARPDPRETAQVLAKLKPGMTRAEVEGVLGTPGPQDIHPATISDGIVTYSTTYAADLGPPATVRPIRHHLKLPVPPVRDAQPATPTVVILQFDATKPGHPLLGIYYPDPLF